MRRRYLRWTALVLLAALGLWTRAQFVEMYGGRAPDYDEWANAHYFGGLSAFYIHGAERWREGAPYRDLVYPPGYVAILATEMDLAGGGLHGARVVQGAFDASAVAAVYLLAGAIGLSAPFALGAAASYAVLPLWAAGSVFPLAESAAVPLLLWGLVLAVRSGKSASLLTAAVAGLWFGCAALVRPELLLFGALVPVFFFWLRGRHGARIVSAFVLAFAIPIASWGVHNRRAHGHWTISSASGGATLWEGLGEISNPFGYVLDDSAANHVLAAHGYGWATVEGSAYLTGEYWRAWREHPAFVARVFALRGRRILFSSERLQPLFFGHVREAIDALGLLALLLALWWKRRDRAAVFVLSVLPVYALGTIGLLHYEPRYVRYVPVSYVLALCLVAAELWRRVEQRHRRTALVLALCVCVVSAMYSVRELRAIRVAAGAPLGQIP